MATIYRIRALWTGFTGAPGFTNWYCSIPDGTPAAASVAGSKAHDFFDAVKAAIPSAITITVDPDLAVLDSADGVITDYLPMDTAPAPVVGAAAGSYVGPAGIVVNWTTSTVRNGRLMRGKTFLVPCSVGVFDPQGNIIAGTLATVRAAAAAFSAQSAPFSLYVYHRPEKTAPGTGTVGLVTGSNVPDLAAVRRSRRT